MDLIIGTILVSVIASIAISAIYCKISAVRTFKVIDSYVKGVIELAKESIRNARHNE